MPYQSGSGTRTQESQSSNYDYSEVTLEEFLRGQRIINGRLCWVDQRLVRAITELRNAIAGVLRVDLSAVDAALAEATRYSEAIPGVNPPGCEYGAGGGGTDGGGS